MDLQLKLWMTAVPQDVSKVCCKYCIKEILAERNDLKAHRAGVKASGEATIKDDQKSSQLSIATNVTCHISISAVMTCTVLQEMGALKM